MKLLIDTNIFLDFYRSTKESLSILEKLDEHSDKIILTDQIIDEFERNREVVLRELKKNFDFNSKINGFSSSLLQNTPKFGELTDLKRKYEAKRAEIISFIDDMVLNPERDPIYVSFNALVDDAIVNDRLLTRTDEILQKANVRKSIGNPPSSNKYSIGDEINWELVLKFATDDILIVGRDNTYQNNLSFLKKEFHRQTGRFVYGLTELLTEGFEKVGIETPDTLKDIEKRQVEDLHSVYWRHQNTNTDQD